MKFRIVSMVCEYFFGYESYEADFGPYFVTFLTECESTPEQIVLIKSIQFVLDPNLASASEAIGLIPKNIPTNKNSFVNLDLEVWDTDNVIRKISVLRKSKSLNFVTIFENDCITKESIKKFQRNLKTHVSYGYPFIDLNIDEFWGRQDSLEFVIYERMNFCKQASIDCTNMIAAGHQIHETINREHFKNILENLQLLRICERVNYMQTRFSLTNKIREIFEKLTDSRYTARFAMKAQDVVKDLLEDSIDDYCTGEFMTLIKAGEDEILWTTASDELKAVLRIATEIAVAQEFDLSVIFIKNIDAIIRHRKIQEAASIIYNRLSEDVSEISAGINYVKNLIDVCSSLKIQAIVECSGHIYEGNCGVLSVTQPIIMTPPNAEDFLTAMGFAE